MKRVQYFNWARDIPLRFPTTTEEPDYCCEGKHIILEKLLRNAGLEVRPRICETRWSNIKQIPSEILAVPHDNDILHLYLEVKLNGRWYQIDATIDKGLASVLPVNEWDGKTSTPLCVEPTKIYTPKQSLEWCCQNEEYTEDFARNGRFYRAINSWLDNIRKTI